MLALHQIAHLPVFHSHLEQNGNLCNKGPQVSGGGGRGGLRLEGQLCRETPAAGSKLEKNLVRNRKQMKNSQKTTVKTLDF